METQRIGIDIEASRTTVERTMTVGGPVTSSSPGFVLGAVPPAIPASQLYYWTSLWQEGERESREDIDRGDAVRFSDPLDAIRWLLSSEE